LAINWANAKNSMVANTKNNRVVRFMPFSFHKAAAIEAPMPRALNTKGDWVVPLDACVRSHTPQPAL
jgi:hypothetical protein